jgi:hypothetical protein
VSVNERPAGLYFRQLRHVAFACRLVSLVPFVVILLFSADFAVLSRDVSIVVVSEFGLLGEISRCQAVCPIRLCDWQLHFGDHS